MITMYGADWCGDCVRTKTQLTELGVEFEFLDTEAGHREKAIEICGEQAIPVVVFPDGEYLVEPSNDEVEMKLLSLDLVT
jgi:glutaredoxin